ncbi:unnamed protein product [Microthlaspi erraticum]|uniref:Reverse transcriptase zinc-binding domain-containing protein n=1 Tax=Microthlaspi erraticum TaxID=1685480 RepID=A0A6D2IVD1_9BRAS|nr:unnamed protein product [Microthlaspi erraticum]
MAGRLTLIKAVLSSVPVHSMSSIILPQSTLANLDRVSRSFLWGSSVEKRKPHLLSWKKVCRSKKEGGLGIRASKDMNLALIAKVGWRLLKDDHSLWARVLKKKYRVGDLREQSWLKPKSNWSILWRGVAKGIREVVVPGHRWIAGDGGQIRFWSDTWLSDRPLGDQAVVELPPMASSVLVKDVWRDGAGWDLASIEPFLSENSKLELMAVVVDHVTGASDRLAWKGNADGEFSVTSAYQLVTRETLPLPNMESFFDRVWRVAVPERVRVFIWLVSQQVIMTNVERRRRHLSDTDVCSVCKGDFETLIHILRDCPAMLGIWERIVPTRKRHQFFSQTLLEWVFDNLQLETNVEEPPWSIMFAMGVWWGWKWRCGNVFGEKRLCRDRVQFVKELAAEVWRANKASGQHVAPRARVERQIGWEFPNSGWFKLNTDGASPW